MSVVVLDTDVASSLLRRRTPDVVERELVGHVLAVRFVTVGELTKWTLVRRWGPRSLADMQTFLGGLVVLPYDQRVSARWGGLQAYAQLRAAGQRLLDRGVLPSAGPAAGHVQHQGLHRLRGARGPAAAAHLVADAVTPVQTGCSARASRGRSGRR